MRPVDQASVQELQEHNRHGDLIAYKGHTFVPIVYHLPTNCEACTKALWNVIKPPPAIECQRKCKVQRNKASLFHIALCFVPMVLRQC